MSTVRDRNPDDSERSTGDSVEGTTDSGGILGLFGRFDALTAQLFSREMYRQAMQMTVAQYILARDHEEKMRKTYVNAYMCPSCSKPQHEWYRSSYIHAQKVTDDRGTYTTYGPGYRCGTCRNTLSPDEWKAGKVKKPSTRVMRTKEKADKNFLSTLDLQLRDEQLSLPLPEDTRRTTLPPAVSGEDDIASIMDAWENA